jgi:hypothetical protein
MKITEIYQEWQRKLDTASEYDADSILTEDPSVPVRDSDGADADGSGLVPRERYAEQVQEREYWRGIVREQSDTIARDRRERHDKDDEHKDLVHALCGIIADQTKRIETLTVSHDQLDSRVVTLTHERNAALEQLTDAQARSVAAVVHALNNEVNDEIPF